MALWQQIDDVPAGEAHVRLQKACGAHRWVTEMVIRRPFGSKEALLRVADEVWWSLSPEDWKESFTHHPKIGDVESLRARFPATHELSTREQAGVAGATDDVIAALADGNREYLEKFGYIFIVCASGKSAGEMLALLKARMPNDAETELRIAAGEQAKITALRLGL